MKGTELKRTMPAFGGSTLLVIFAVLCLAVLAMLSLNTALAQARLSEGAVQSITDYYAADLEAESILARLRAGEVPAGVEVQEGRYSYACPVSARQTLQVEVKQEAGAWIVLRWQTVPEEILADDSLLVWKGEKMP